MPIEDLESWYLDLAGCAVLWDSKYIKVTRFSHLVEKAQNVKNRHFLGRHFVNFQHFSILIEYLESWYLDLAGCAVPWDWKNI